MKEFTLAMSLADLIPVVLYALAFAILQKKLYSKIGRTAFMLVSVGSADVTIAGALKALYKMLYALGICDFQALSNLFFPLQAIGFLLCGLGMVRVLSKDKQERLMLIAVPTAVMSAPALFSGTFVFVGLMVAGVALTDGSLALMAKRRKKGAAAVLFLIALVGSLGMGYLSTKNFDKAIFNWIAEGVNVLAQASLLLGVLILGRKKSEEEPVSPAVEEGSVLPEAAAPELPAEE